MFKLFSFGFLSGSVLSFLSSPFYLRNRDLVFVNVF